MLTVKNPCRISLRALELMATSSLQNESLRVLTEECRHFLSTANDRIWRHFMYLRRVGFLLERRRPLGLLKREASVDVPVHRVNLPLKQWQIFRPSDPTTMFSLTGHGVHYLAALDTIRSGEWCVCSGSPPASERIAAHRIFASLALIRAGSTP
jgi:hypothetical protein